MEEAAKAAYALGYDSLWANDLVIVPASFANGKAFQVIEPLITLATLVHLVPRLKLGTSVLVLPQRNTMLSVFLNLKTWIIIFAKCASLLNKSYRTSLKRHRCTRNLGYPSFPSGVKL